MKEQRFIITESMMDSLYGYNNAQYDQHAKRLLASRKLLAEIVKKVVPEFHDVSTTDIAEKYIEGAPQVGNIPVNPGLTNAVPSQIKGDRNEDGAPKEGYITYDILFHARAPGTGGAHHTDYQRGGPAYAGGIHFRLSFDETGCLLRLPPDFLTKGTGSCLK